MTTTQLQIATRDPIPRAKLSQLKTKLESQRSIKPPSGIPKSSVSSALD
jgi:hypothetical protein